ncbi:hypothetical protein CASFOL_024863 [Castilleja foliolosa]|uniref:EamA domain-containing protein n=1 Tax=Castilleja foliolosa TaxID=1961234 RepID=A0ABD3CS00_9LAMI
MKIVFFSISFFILVIGICGSQLLTRLYFIHGGKRLWFSSWLQTGAFPVLLAPLLVAYTRRLRGSTGTKLFYMKPRVLAAASVIGIPSGLCSYLYVYGFSLLPVSTASLILASQLVFTAVFAFLLVKQKFTAYSINAVILVTLASAVLAMHTSSDSESEQCNSISASS